MNTHPVQVTLATELFALSEQKTAIEEREKELRAELLDQLKRQGVSSVRLEDGTTFTRSIRSSLKVKDADKAWKWATDRNALKIDLARSLKILRHDLSALPKFFTKTNTEYLTIRRKGQEEEVEE